MTTPELYQKLLCQQEVLLRQQEEILSLLRQQFSFPEVRKITKTERRNTEIAEWVRTLELTHNTQFIALLKKNLSKRKLWD